MQNKKSLHFEAFAKMKLKQLNIYSLTLTELKTCGDK